MTKQLLLKLDPNSPTPIYKQISDGIAEVIDSGRLSPGELLPSTRVLSADLSVSRLTIRRSYLELASQGYIKAFQRGKTIVSKSLVKRNLKVPAAAQVNPEISAYGQEISRLCDIEEMEEESHFSKGAIAVSELPFIHWKNCLQIAIRKFESSSVAEKSDPFGLDILRNEITRLLARSRGITCSKDQIIIFPSTTSNFDVITRLLLNKGDSIAVEDPSYSGMRASLRGNGFELEQIPLDEEGIDIRHLSRLEVKPKLVYVTPSHQDPTGITMSQQRRAELLSWAKNNGSLIIEDDFDSEYHYGENIQPALMAEDESGTVIYIYNFWKSLYPLLRISVAVVPKSVIPVFQKAMKLLNRDFPLIEQIALAEFIKRGHYGKHLHSRKKIFGLRRALLIRAFTVTFANELKIRAKSGGTDLLLRFPPEWESEVIKQAAKKSDICMSSTRFSYENVCAPRNEYLINFSMLPESEIESRVESFGRLCRHIPRLRQLKGESQVFTGETLSFHPVNT